MHIVALAWMFVVVLMALAEATSTQGSVLGAFFTLLLYGVLPLGLVLYLLGTPMRRRAQRVAEAAALADPAPDDTASIDAAQTAPSALQRHGGGETAGAAIAPERKKP